ncbi:hypothetical protein [Sinisalibacter lacisalsi]|uniref:Uncharacterized protein n=1 Tax=Sinisalibacter lacisalsi TaxID=1526570 RepID=A0ABQ1QMC9_9RHOB|nr:hypothetical protein [Sinisalibacter lacisalsi]GGD31262.1 hypothetical protein GCM10011358_14100 [Sinisalibacter lacisalsi]
MAKLDSQGMLFAEIDENGELACVWIRSAGARYPRPIRARDIAGRARDLDHYTIVGSSRASIAAWMKRRTQTLG